MDLGRVPGPVDADDAWSETFLAALRAYPELSADANVRAWLVTIAHRKAIDQLRARGRRPVPTELPDRALPAHPAADPDLVDAVRELPPAQRLAVTYHYVARMPYAEVAELTGADLDYVARFEGPVTAEREHIVASALAVRVYTSADPDPLEEGAI